MVCQGRRRLRVARDVSSKADPTGEVFIYWRSAKRRMREPRRRPTAHQSHCCVRRASQTAMWPIAPMSCTSRAALNPGTTWTTGWKPNARGSDRVRHRVVTLSFERRRVFSAEAVAPRRRPRASLRSRARTRLTDPQIVAKVKDTTESLAESASVNPRFGR